MPGPYGKFRGCESEEKCTIILFFRDQECHLVISPREPLGALAEPDQEFVYTIVFGVARLCREARSVLIKIVSRGHASQEWVSTSRDAMDELVDRRIVRLRLFRMECLLGWLMVGQ